jgi:ubiquinone/menaquinone biosynthesis C-methylase UbiE
MMKHLQSKFENPERLIELNPEGTLKKIGIRENDVVVDIGAGSGVFAIPAAKITNNFVYALEINEKFLEIINVKAKNEKLTNIKTMVVSDSHYDIGPNLVDLVILVTVFHEIDKKDDLLCELRRITKNTGKIAIIEFKKQQTSMGPPVSHRVSKDEVVSMFDKYGFIQSTEFSLGNNLYCIVFESSNMDGKSE